MAGMSLSDYLLAELREIADLPTLAEFRERLHQRKPLPVALDTSRLFAHLLDVEIAQVLRRLVRGGTLARNRAEEAMEDLIVVRVARYALSCSSIGSGS